MNTVWIVIIAVIAIIACTTAGCLIAQMIKNGRKTETPVFEIDTNELDGGNQVSTREKKEGEYTGILHISRGRYKFERPVMYVIYNNKPVYFTYNEEGKKVTLSNNPKLIADIKEMLKDHSYKSKLIKWYPINE